MRLIFFGLWLSAVVDLRFSVAINPSIAEDVNLNTWQLIRKYGYPYEIHDVPTADGYVLQLHRIPSGRTDAIDGKTASKPVVFLQHGLLGSSASWVTMGPQQSLAYILADSGFDVWLGNSRGNIYSKRHVQLQPQRNASDGLKFWNFSWHEMGVYDLPACIDYILQKTGERQLDYVGHSQGGTQFFVLASERSEYMAAIRTANLLAPAVFMGNMRRVTIQALSAVIEMMTDLDSSYAHREFFSTPADFSRFGVDACADGDITQRLCMRALSTLAGVNETRVNRTMLPVLLGHYPQGASLKQVNHYGQEMTSGHFCQYDNGYMANWAAYGRLTPPDYDLTRATVPIGVHYGANDLMVGVRETQHLIAMLPNVVLDHLVEDPSWNHIDFVYAFDAPQLVYEAVVAVMRVGDANRMENLV